MVSYPHAKNRTGYVIYLYKTTEKLNDKTKFWFLTVTGAMKEFTGRIQNSDSSKDVLQFSNVTLTSTQCYMEYRKMETIYGDNLMLTYLCSIINHSNPTIN